MKKVCSSCGVGIEILGEYHAGFSDVGFLYCDSDTTVATFNVADPRYVRMVGQVNPWTLVEEERQLDLSRIEKALLPCPCGGAFLFSNPLRCPECRGILSKPMSLSSIYYVVVKGQVDGDSDRIWRETD